ncbi:hypothetical protein HanIR_Chr05g0208311 [Helianthus annuus]|nr:hypothetical protein HanIR_Chr05g0208311 [Helianthus annuus]
MHRLVSVVFRHGKPPQPFSVTSVVSDRNIIRRPTRHHNQATMSHPQPHSHTNLYDLINMYHCLRFSLEFCKTLECFAGGF